MELPKKIPNTMDEAINILTYAIPPDEQLEIMSLEEEDFTSGSHFGGGMQIRNDWGLWQDSDLAKWFEGLGIEHPDDMSSIILTSFYRTITSKPLDLEGQIKYYIDWHKEND